MIKNFIKSKYRIISLYILIFLTIIIIIIRVSGEQVDVSLSPLYPVPKSITQHFSPNEKFYVVNFFASWCKACIAEHDNIMKLKKISKAHIYGIAINDDTASVNNILKKQGNPFIKVSFSFPVDSLNEIELTRIPRTLVIYNNAVVYDHSGEINNNIFNKKLLPVMEQILNLELEERGELK